MKRLLGAIICVVFLLGCGKTNDGVSRATSFRQALLNANCSFNVAITADYGEFLHTFSMACTGNENGELAFTVIEPESISGIAGKITQEGGKLTFDDQTLAFPLLADGQLTPVSAPWLLLKTLRGGYISSAGRDGKYTRVSIDDSYEEDALRLDIWMDENFMPIQAEVLWQGRRILSMEIKNFQIL